MMVSLEQIIAYGDPNLREYSILARSVERLDVQSLFNPFEETFHLPALSIEFRYSKVGMSEIVAQKSINPKIRNYQPIHD